MHLPLILNVVLAICAVLHDHIAAHLLLHINLLCRHLLLVVWLHKAILLIHGIYLDRNALIQCLLFNAIVTCVSKARIEYVATRNLRRLAEITGLVS